MNYLLHLFIYFSIYAVLAISLNIIVGYCGLLTLAHAAFFALGGYGYAIARVAFGWGFLPALAVAAAVAGFFSLAVSLPTWRLSGDFFVLVSLAVQTLIVGALQNWYSPVAPIGTLRNLTNGSFGINGIPGPTQSNTAGFISTATLIFAGLLLVICSFIMWRLIMSPWGRTLQAVRDDALAARTLGKNIRLFKLQAFFVSCVIAGMAGALYAAYVGFIDPGSAALDQSILMLSLIVVGGTGNWRGPYIGAALLLLIPEILRRVNIPAEMAAEVRLAIYGILLVVLMHIRPQGIAGEYSQT